MHVQQASNVAQLTPPFPPDKGLTEQEYKDIVLEDVTVAGRQRAVCSMMLVLTATILDDIQT